MPETNPDFQKIRDELEDLTKRNDEKRGAIVSSRYLIEKNVDKVGALMTIGGAGSLLFAAFDYTGLIFTTVGLIILAYDKIIRKPHQERKDEEDKISLDIMEHHLNKLKKKR